MPLIVDFFTLHRFSRPGKKTYSTWSCYFTLRYVLVDSGISLRAWSLLAAVVQAPWTQPVVTSVGPRQTIFAFTLSYHFKKYLKSLAPSSSIRSGSIGFFLNIKSLRSVQANTMHLRSLDGARAVAITGLKMFHHRQKPIFEEKRYQKKQVKSILEVSFCGRQGNSTWSSSTTPPSSSYTSTSTSKSTSFSSPSSWTHQPPQNSSLQHV